MIYKNIKELQRKLESRIYKRRRKALKSIFAFENNGKPVAMKKLKIRGGL